MVDQPSPSAQQAHPLDARAITKRYGAVQVLDGLDLCVQAGEITVLRGPNGAGKSTLIGCVGGTTIPDAGSIRIAGHDLRSAPLRARASLRLLAQEVAIPEGLTGREWIDFHADVFDARAHVERAYASSGLAHHLDLLAATYSVGMRKRAALAALGLGDGRLAVLDEPFAGLDADGRMAVIDFITAVATRGGGVLIAAHGQDDVDLARFSVRTIELSRRAHAPPDAASPHGRS